MKRMIYEKLLKWKQDRDRKPLVMEGARQTGKTWILKEFGKNEYENLVYINCDNNEDMVNIFADYDVDRILRTLSAVTGQQIIPGKTLIFLDEIQEVGKGLTALKYFNENRSDIHIAVAGSLLGITMHGGSGFPVGKVDTIKLFPMNFQEFLVAMSEEGLADLIENHRWEEYTGVKNKLTDLLRQYYYVGGMPEAVGKYAEERDILKIRRIQNNILSDYRRDFSKHIPAGEVGKVNLVWDSVLPQLAKDNKKFIYGVLKGGARAREYEGAIQWLYDAGLIYRIERVSKLDKPLGFYRDNGIFKLYLLDVGLLGAMAKTEPADMLIGNTGFVEYKGAFTENYIAQEIIASSVTDLFYYVNERSSVEIDFVVQGKKVFPIEVKAEENLRSKSLKSVLEKNTDSYGWRFSMSDFRKQDRMTNIPLYLAGEWVKDNIK